MQHDTQEVYEEWLREVTHGLPWHTAQKLLESIERDRKAKAESIAKRLLGKQECPVCFGDGTGNNGYCMRCSGMNEDGN